MLLMAGGREMILVWERDASFRKYKVGSKASRERDCLVYPKERILDIKISSLRLLCLIIDHKPQNDKIPRQREDMSNGHLLEKQRTSRIGGENLPENFALPKAHSSSLTTFLRPWGKHTERVPITTCLLGMRTQNYFFRI